ncbi:MAG: HD domain-containing protein [Chloroflexota bacterium]
MRLIDKAIEVAARAHRNQVRKGTDIPYIAHPCGVAMMLAQSGCRDEVVAAGVLHDTVEDTDLTLEYLLEEFGEEVAAIVEGCSEPSKSMSWEERKKHTIEHMATASWEVRAVSCADKLYNLRSIAYGEETLGEEVWTRFKRGRTEQEWYYRSMADVLSITHPGEPGVPLSREFREEVEKVFPRS